MAQAPTITTIFDDCFQACVRLPGYGQENFLVTARLAEAQTKHPDLQDLLTFRTFCEYRLELPHKLNIPFPNPSEVFGTASNCIHTLPQYREENLMTAAQIYEDIGTSTRDIHDYDESLNMEKTKLAEAKAKYPYVQGLTLTDFYKDHSNKHRAGRRLKRQKPPRTGKELFETAYNSKPMGPDGGRDLHELPDSNYFERIELGLFRGHTRLDLLAGIGILPSAEIPGDCTKLDLAYTNGGAISYAASHPSTSTNPQAPGLSSEEKGPLRRLMPLGWVTKINSPDGKEWARTGHVLGIDMDDEHGRDRHPWFVLASEWPD